MIVDGQKQQDYSNSKYYHQFYNVATLVEHVIQCFQTIVTDETNPYHPPLSWLTRKTLKPPPEDQLITSLFDECSQSLADEADSDKIGPNERDLSIATRTSLERCSPDLRKDITSKTKDGCSPLFMACMNGYIKIVKFLIEICGADLEQKGRYEVFEDHREHSVTPIWMAAVRGNFDIVDQLIQYGANINSPSDSGSTSLRSVCYLCREDDGSESINRQQQSVRSQQLLANIDQDDNINRINIDDNHYNINEIDNRPMALLDEDIYFRIVKLLIKMGADVTQANHNGGTCLINSVHNYHLIKYILSHGADINASDHESKTALHYAIHQGRTEACKLLLQEGADPMLTANNNDDALQLSCIGGHVDIFKHLISNYTYPKERIRDAYRLIGSSILELCPQNISLVKEMWLHSLIVDKFIPAQHISTQSDQPDMIEATILRRDIAYGRIVEFVCRQDLDHFSADDFRMQSLLICERVLGMYHRETIQRIVWRGTCYINSLRPERCIDLWIYALNLRLRTQSIFHFESILAAQAITKLFTDLINQNQLEVFKMIDICDVLTLAVDELESCKSQLCRRPRFRQHEDIFDLLLKMIVNLLLALIRMQRLQFARLENFNEPKDDKLCDPELKQQKAILVKLMKKLAIIDPKDSKGCSLLHLCVALSCQDNSISVKLELTEKLAAIELIEMLTASGHEVDSTNNDGMSPLQVCCLTGNLWPPAKTAIVRCLIELGAHLDRRPADPEQVGLIWAALSEAGVKPIDHSSLACMAARRLVESRVQIDTSQLAANLRYMLSIH